MGGAATPPLPISPPHPRRRPAAGRDAPQEQADRRGGRR